MQTAVNVPMCHDHLCLCCSNVLEKCLVYGSQAERVALIEELCEHDRLVSCQYKPQVECEI